MIGDVVLIPMSYGTEVDWVKNDGCGRRNASATSDASGGSRTRSS
ncbi:MAG: hypothetical protein U0838_08230 [Chloroflexota bacterium]